MVLADLSSWLDDTLCVAAFPHDLGANTLQLEAGKTVHHLLFAVDASMATFEEAQRIGADLVVVHHGLFWGSGVRALQGVMAHRVAFCFQHNISLYASHLPLDAHPLLGNNAQLADCIHLSAREPFFTYAGVKIGLIGELAEPQSMATLASAFAERTQSSISSFNADKACTRVAIVSGGAGTDGVAQAIVAGVDVLITGAFEHESFHAVQESGLGVLALGHYASETFGVRALQAYCHAQFPALTCSFFDCPTGL